MGKSTVAAFLQKADFPVVDTDTIARELTVAGGAALPEIVRVFGREVLANDGGLNRPVMADQVFHDAKKRLQLESILHPMIRFAWQEQVRPFRGVEEKRILVVIPLLFETACEGEFDRVVCVACRPEEQQERLRVRGWSDSQANARIKAQWPIERKICSSDMVIWTSCRLEWTYRQLAEEFGLELQAAHGWDA